MSDPDKTLWHLSLADQMERKRAALDEDEVVAPSEGQWRELLHAIVDAFDRQWVSYIDLKWDGHTPHLSYGLTARGQRAMKAFRERLKREPFAAEE